MAESFKNQSKKPFTFSLFHDEWCIGAEGRTCTCMVGYRPIAGGKTVEVFLPKVVTIEPGATSDPLPDGVAVGVGAVRNAIRSGILAKTPGRAKIVEA